MYNNQRFSNITVRQIYQYDEMFGELSNYLQVSNSFSFLYLLPFPPKIHANFKVLYMFNDVCNLPSSEVLENLLISM